MAQMNNEVAVLNPQVDLVALRMDTGSHIVNRPSEVLARDLSPMIYAAGTIRGTAIAPETQNAMAGVLAEQLRADFPTLTLPEIGTAIREGCFGKYGEVYGVNPASIYKMVQGYCESEAKMELTRKVREAREQKKQRDAEKMEQWLASHPGYKPSKITYQEYKQSIKNSTTL